MFCALASHVRVGGSVELVLAVKLYNNFAAFSAFDGRDLRLLGSKLCPSFFACVVNDIMLNVLKMVLKV